MIVTLFPGTTLSHRYLRGDRGKRRMVVGNDGTSNSQRVQGGKAVPVPVTVELQVPGHLPVWHGIWRLLQFQDLEIHALALIWHDKIRVQRALWAASLFSVQRDGSGEAVSTEETALGGTCAGDSSDSKGQLPLPSSATSAGKGRHTGPDQRPASPLSCLLQVPNVHIRTSQRQGDTCLSTLPASHPSPASYKQGR